MLVFNKKIIAEAFMRLREKIVAQVAYKQRAPGSVVNWVSYDYCSNLFGQV